MKLSSDLLKILVCPVSKKPLVYDQENNQLISPEAKLAYPIINGIPIMLKEEAKPISEDSIKKILNQKESLEIK